MSPPDRFPLSSAKWQYDNQIRSSTPPTLGSEGVGSAMSYVPDDPASMDDGVSSNLAVELVNLFFEKIQPWLPLLHRPRFQKKYSAKLLAKGNVMKGLTSGESLLMYGMFALSARFSDHSRFEGIPDSDKGNVFAERATDIYIQSHLVQQPLLLQLQGYLVLAYNQHASGPTTLGRVLVGQCLQVAYALGLHDIDHPVRARHRPAVDHVDREEMRRAWWLLWELDTFASCASGKPFLIDRRRMSVMLPISDEAWFAEREVHSAELILGPGQSWKCLENSPNQDERAWCLATVHLMASNLDRLQQPKALAMDEKLAMQNEIACFKLALPLSANLDSEALKLTPTTISRHNWVIAIHLILMTTSFMVDGVAAFEHGQRGDPKTAMAVAVRKRAITLGGIIRLWDPSCIVLALPFLMCGMIPALAMHEDTDSIQPLISSTNDMAVLVLKRFRSKWKLAAIMLEVAQLRKNPDVVNIAKGQLYQRYTIFFRRPRTEKGILKTSSIEAQTQWPEQTGNNLNASHQAHSQPARDSLGSNPDDIPSSTLRPDALGLDWAGWPNLAVDPLGFPAIQPDLYDLGFDFEPPDQTQNLDSSNLMQV
ncbi:uncharacterized protein A1O9_00525 [Exophiala aquamarina CBS 119918]|uniref:Xylanolytic transcriptional activator regulatory domain-containing protein n=1 Tax=Exophiala aquamarina CBS 119918 TaxID=1182545 RepID=A0A072PS03_9EURO|nr:uncharacterized protein A1O9_00525 [Exophiala aquamarina CBS 119918]KEF62552.1 hypothetical protein A1O9_00525 [Exophiala aquamarina CBS 119918]